MKHPILLLYLSAISLSAVHACMEFTGIFPFSHTAHFEASIVDNGVTTCWISTTLAEHDAAQHELFSSQQSHRNKRSKRSVGRKITLTSLPPYDPSSYPPSYKSLPSSSKQQPINEKHVDLTAIPPPRNGQLPKTQKMEEMEWDDIPVWQPWQFECISGYKARANVGMRGFTYVAHGQDFFFVPRMKEDIWGERWVYSSRLWCGEKDKKGRVVERPKPKGAKKEGGKSDEAKQSVRGGDVAKKEGGESKQSTVGGNGGKNGL
ncbi:hypothetical protein BKA65DRAFT_586779 [Rhexocercosporidium sp. MPI-PUGE-AT-0058]|nr:hypothetical protein BKA65DRAFT_586779 [Rhexocercosporidium sp. MPI-PUGE-AT-0058]